MGWMVVSLVSFFAFAPSIASAQVIITEIMFDVEGTDTDREWIEVQNAGSEPVDLTQWKFFESSSNHGLVAHQGGETLAPGSYAVVVDSPVKFLADWPSFSGQVFDSSFALNNTGETLVLRCCGKELSDRDSVTYNATGGGAGDGLSLHRNGSSITAAQPSPGSGAVVAAQPPPPPEPKSEAAPPPPPVKQPETPVQKIVQTMTAEQKTEENKVETQAFSPAAIPPPTIVVQEESEAPPPKAKTKSKKVVVEPEEPVEEVVEEVVREASPTPVLQVAAVESAAVSSDLFWWLGAGAVSLFGAGGAYLAGRSQRRKEDKVVTKDGWKIEEVE